jgi:hypothetical protein
MALKDVIVMQEIISENTKIPNAPHIPIIPTAKPRRKKSTAPRIVSKHGTKHPLNVDSWFPASPPAVVILEFTAILPTSLYRGIGDIFQQKAAERKKE